MGPFRLLYIGNSNKKFTYNKVYSWFGHYDSRDPFSENSPLTVTVYSNNGVLVYFNDNYYDYFYNNFKFITDAEYNKYIRRKKLKKIKDNEILR